MREFERILGEVQRSRQERDSVLPHAFREPVGEEWGEQGMNGPARRLGTGIEEYEYSDVEDERN